MTPPAAPSLPALAAQVADLAAKYAALDARHEQLKVRVTQNAERLQRLERHDAIAASMEAAADSGWAEHRGEMAWALRLVAAVLRGEDPNDAPLPP